MDFSFGIEERTSKKKKENLTQKCSEKLDIHLITYSVQFTVRSNSASALMKAASHNQVYISA